MIDKAADLNAVQEERVARTAHVDADGMVGGEITVLVAFAKLVEAPTFDANSKFSSRRTTTFPDRCPC